MSFSTDSPAVLLIGAAGFFGRLMTSEFLQFTKFNLILAGRTSSALAALTDLQGNNKDRLSTRCINLADKESVRNALNGVAVAVCAAGPYQNMAHFLAEECITRGIPYIDIADDRNFVLATRKLASADSTAVCSGWSSMPALSGILVEILRQNQEPLSEIHIQIAPGNRAPRSTSTVGSLLSSVGAQFDIWRQRQWQTVTGFTQPRRFHFPEPVGSKTGYLVDVPDHQLFPDLFQADSVEFRVGAEFQFFNFGSNMLAHLRHCGLLKDLTGLAPLLQGVMSLTGSLGHDWGALGVEVKDSAGQIRRATIVSDHNGHAIPVMPAVLMAELLVKTPDNYRGLVPLNTWIDRTELTQACSRRNYQLILDGC